MNFNLRSKILRTKLQMTKSNVSHYRQRPPWKHMHAHTGVGRFHFKLRFPFQRRDFRAKRVIGNISDVIFGHHLMSAASVSVHQR